MSEHAALFCAGYNNSSFGASRNFPIIFRVVTQVQGESHEHPMASEEPPSR